MVSLSGMHFFDVIVVGMGCRTLLLTMNLGASILAVWCDRAQSVAAAR